MRNGKKLTWLTVTLFWGCVVFGLTLHGIVMITHNAYRRHGAWAEAFQEFRLHLFAPGYNFFLIGVLNALPFVLLAIFILFHLGMAARRQEPVLVSRRLAGVAGALAAAIGLSTWAHLATTLHPDAQGALIYLFLPIYLMGVIPLGYAVGRLAGTLLFKQPAPPA